VDIGGLVGGVLAGWVFRERRTTPSGQPGRPQKAVTSPPVDTTLTDLRRQLDDTATDYLP
jgi:hypothetical protein